MKVLNPKPYSIGCVFNHACRDKCLQFRVYMIYPKPTEVRLLWLCVRKVRCWHFTMLHSMLNINHFKRNRKWALILDMYKIKNLYIIFPNTYVCIQNQWLTRFWFLKLQWRTSHLKTIFNSYVFFWNTYAYEFATRIFQTHEKSLLWKGMKYVQVINSLLVSNPWTSSTNKQKFNRKKPSKKMKPFLYFYEFINRISQIHEKRL